MLSVTDVSWDSSSVNTSFTSICFPVPDSNTVPAIFFIYLDLGLYKIKSVTL